MRGKHGVYVLAFGGHGITPADAGKTFTEVRRHHDFRDHPRGCGENAVERKNGARLRGSPPRMRGKLSSSARLSITVWITPADAGKTIMAKVTKI